MAKYVTETLQDLNNDVNGEAFKTNNSLKEILKYAFLPQFKFILPEGNPPYREDSAPQGMTPSNMWQEIRRFYVFLRADLTPVKREGLFISMLEGLYPEEAKLLLLIKDQNITSKYPNITSESIAHLLV